MKIKTIGRIIFFVACAQAAGVIGSFVTMPAIGGWYDGLKKPFFVPPAALFGPVWFALYTMMGVSAALVAGKKSEHPDVKNAMVLFFTQLILNVFWSIFFFGMKSPFLAFLEILVLLASVAVTMVLFFRIQKTAGWLLVPYVVWVAFAGVLNFSIYRLNP
jgi:tryptophan-rich sensory protein